MPSSKEKETQGKLKEEDRKKPVKEREKQAQIRQIPPQKFYAR